MKNLLHQIKLRFINARPALSFGVMLLVAAVGIAFWQTGRASSPVASLEPENGTLSAAATRSTDNSASGNSAIKFGNGVTPSTFTLVSIPDTQRDLWSMNTINNNFNDRFQYIVDHKNSLNIKYVWQVGDLEDTDNLLCAKGTPPDQMSTCSHDLSVNPRYEPNPPFNIDHFQYYWASQGLKILDNNNVPYALTIGNHDGGAVCGGPACPVVSGQTGPVYEEVRNTAAFNSFYSPARLHISNSQGTSASDTSGVYETDKVDNTYRTFDAGGLKFLLIDLELWPRAEVYGWANAVVSSHPNYNVIVVTHAYLNSNSTIQQDNGGYGATSPQYMFDNFVKLHSNIRFVFSGHVGNSGYRVDTGVNGNKIYDMLDCYHDTTNDWIRLLNVDVANNEITTQVYSPVNNKYRTEADANLDITNIDWVR